jgi:hypothetical protein
LNERIVTDLFQPEKYPIEFEFANDPKPRLTLEDKIYKSDYNSLNYYYYVDFKAQLDSEKKFKDSLPKSKPLYFIACSKHLQNPFDLFLDKVENSLYVVEEAYQHIWKIPMDTGIAEDVLPIVIQQEKEFQDFKNKIFPNSDYFHKEIPNMRVEWEYLKNRQKSHFYSVSNEIHHFFHLEKNLIAGNKKSGFKDGSNALFNDPIHGVELNEALYIPDTSLIFLT